MPPPPLPSLPGAADVSLLYKKLGKMNVWITKKGYGDYPYQAFVRKQI